MKLLETKPISLDKLAEKLLERQHLGNPFIVREINICTTQTLPDPIQVTVPGLTVLDGGLKEGRYRCFRKRIKLEDKRYDATINLQELIDDYATLFSFDSKLASHLVVDDLILLDYSGMGKKTRGEFGPPKLVWFRRMPKRRLPSKIMEESMIDDRACLQIALDCIAIKTYSSKLSERWKFIGTDPKKSIIDPIDLPEICPAIFDRPVEKDDLIKERRCYIPPDDPLYKAICLRAIGVDLDWSREVPEDVRKVIEGKGKESAEEEE